MQYRDRLRSVTLLMQGMGARMRRDNLRRTWVPTGKDLKRLEEERGVVIRFVIGYRYSWSYGRQS